jgi:AbrB family looped-hinge helix DNA binding protein
MAIATLSSKGQITVPIEVRRALGVDTGDRLDFVQTGEGRFEIVPATRDVRQLKGLVKSKVGIVTLDQMNQAIRKRAGR